MNWSLLGPIIALGIFVAGLIYSAGQQGQRLRALEEWRKELREDMARLNDKLDGIAALIRGDDR